MLVIGLQEIPRQGLIGHMLGPEWKIRSKEAGQIKGVTGATVRSSLRKIETRI